MGSYESDVIKPGDRASKLAHRVCVESYNNCPAVVIVPHRPDNFRGAVGFTFNRALLLEMANNPPDRRVLMEAQNDGAGGKLQFCTLLNNPEAFRKAGREVIAMAGDDIARFGGLPVLMVNEFNTRAITDANFPCFEACMKGYGEGLKETNLVNLTGEFAIMKTSITSFCSGTQPDLFEITWGGTCFGLSRSDLLIDGSAIKPGMPIVGLGERGYRCNGGTYFVNLLTRLYPDLHLDEEGRSFVEALTIPSQIYAPTICQLIGWNKDGTRGYPSARIVGVGHITGGGVWHKFVEMLPEGIGAVLDKMPNPPEVLLRAQQMSQESDEPLSDYNMYYLFHGGCGMLIVCQDYRSVEAIIALANHNGIEAQLVGKTHSLSQNSERLVIHSRFHDYGKELRLES